MDFSDKCAILGQVWLRYKPNVPRILAGEIDGNTQFWGEFFAYNDLGLPLAYIIDHDIADLNDGEDIYIEETWSLLCKVLGVDPDDEYPSLEALLLASPYVSFEE